MLGFGLMLGLRRGLGLGINSSNRGELLSWVKERGGLVKRNEGVGKIECYWEDRMYFICGNPFVSRPLTPYRPVTRTTHYTTPHHTTLYHTTAQHSTSHHIHTLLLSSDNTPIFVLPTIRTINRITAQPPSPALFTTCIHCTCRLQF